MSFTRWSPLLGTLVRLDDTGTGPPWPLEVYNPDTHAWEAVGIVGAQGPAGPAGAVGPAGSAGAMGPACPVGLAAGSLLVLLPNPYNFVASTATDSGQPPDFVLTATGDVIGVAGR